MKKVFLCLLIATFGYGSWYFLENYNDIVKDLSTVQIPGLDREMNLLTFEAAFTPDQLMQSFGRELLKDESRTFSKVTTKFLPFLLFNVKYTHDDKTTTEGKLLWSLESGEMLLNTSHFAMTQGFEDCINAKASDEDFRLLHILQKHGGQLSKDMLCQELGIEANSLLNHLEGLRKKHLIAIRNDMVRIHLTTPLLGVMPTTAILHPIVIKNASTENQIPTRYSKEQIRNIAKAAFGPDFAIRSEETLYVPIFQIDVQNPDGSTLKTYWNALTGQKIELRQIL